MGAEVNYFSALNYSNKKSEFSWRMENLPLILEILGTVFGLAYVVLAAKKNIWCWLMGILASLCSIYLFYVYSKLYAEALLSAYYVVTGVIGWVYWSRPKKELPVIRVRWWNHVVFIVVGIVLSIVLYKILSTFFPDAEKKLLDSFTTMFSFLATWITIKKWLSNWIYWIVIDAVTVAMYWSRGLNIYAGLMVVYTVLAVYGYLEWKKEYLKAESID